MSGPSSDPPTASVLPLPPAPDRLESWKEIAAYLKRSVSTVQRWEQEEHLPVHRLIHSKAGSVYGAKGESTLGTTGAPRCSSPIHSPNPTPVAVPVPTLPAEVARGTPAETEPEPDAPQPRQGDGPLAQLAKNTRLAVIDAARDSWRGPAALLLSRVSPHEISVAVVEPGRWSRVRRRLLHVVGPTVACTAVLTAAVTWWWVRPVAVVAPLVRTQINVAPANELNAGGFRPDPGPEGGARTALTFTPDGRALIFVGRQQGEQRIFVRGLADAEAMVLAGTDGAQVPTVSPDGRWIAFWADNEIRRVPRAGGPVQAVARDVPVPPAGMAITANGRVMFSAGTPPGEPFTESIWSVGVDAAPARVTTPRPGELAHLTPQLLPGDRVLLYTVKRAEVWGREHVVAQDLATGATTVLVEDAADGRYDAASGHLLFMRRGLLMAVPLDLATLSVAGEPVVVAEQVAQALLSGNGLDITGAGQFAVTATALAYVRGAPLTIPSGPLVVLDRQGHVTRLPFEPRAYDTLDLSPDGRRLAVPIATLTQKGLFVADLSRNTLTRLPPWGEPVFPRWSPDGRFLAFLTLRGAAWELARQRADGSGEPTTILPGRWWVSSWSPDGRATSRSFTKATSGSSTSPAPGRRLGGSQAPASGMDRRPSRPTAAGSRSRRG